MPDRARILVFHDEPALGGLLLAHLASEGFNAVDANTPLEVVWTLASGEVQLLVVHVFDVVWIAAALLTELFSFYPTMPVLVLVAPTVSAEDRQLLVRFENARVLNASDDLRGITEAIQEMLCARSRACSGGGA